MVIHLQDVVHAEEHLQIVAIYTVLHTKICVRIVMEIISGRKMH